jgi:hypothetical protein
MLEFGFHRILIHTRTNGSVDCEIVREIGSGAGEGGCARSTVLCGILVHGVVIFSLLLFVIFLLFVFVFILLVILLARLQDVGGVGIAPVGIK